MYWGSVRFFKHVIVGAVVALIVASTGSAFYFGFSCYRLSNQILLLNVGEPAGASAASRGLLTVYAAEGGENPASSILLPYQKKYEDLYVENDFTYAESKDKTVYLTFDDGPSSLTPKVLDLLAAYDVKATFFIVYKDDDEAKALYKRMVDEGHTLAVHSTTHKYKEIYQSVDTYLADFAQTARMLENVTGEKPELFRFPGGSVNAYNRSIYKSLIAEMSRRGYTYYDWNVGSDDTTSQISTEQIRNNVIDGVHQRRESTVLMHDLASHTDTLEALPGIIQTLQAEGYSFSALDKSVRPVAFGYAK